MTIDIERFIRPSALTKLSLCPAAARMEATVVDRFGEPEISIEADVGTRIHWYVAEAIKRARDTASGWDDIIAMVCSEAASEMDTWSVRCIRLCIEFAGELIKEHRIERSHILVEHELDMEGAGFRQRGTADLVLVIPFHLVIVVDWKCGHLDQGEAVDHDQIMAYAIAAAVTFKSSSVIVHLFQPRADKPRRESAAGFNAKALMANAAWSIAVTARAREENPELMPSYHACHHCKALHRCQAAKEWTMRFFEAIDLIGSPTDAEGWGMTIAAAKIAEAQAAQALHMAKAHLVAGGAASGWTLQPGRIQTKIDTARAIELARAGGFLDVLLQYASIRAEAAKAIPGIEDATRGVPTAPSIRPDRSST